MSNMIQRRWLLDDLPFPCQTFSVFVVNNGKSNWIGTVGTVIDYLHLEEVICLWRWKPAIAKILIYQMRNREEFQTHEWYHYHDHVDSSYIGSFVLSQGTLGMEKKSHSTQLNGTCTSFVITTKHRFMLVQCILHLCLSLNCPSISFICSSVKG